ncbi:unnamed protein product [Linum trigynum]|uniref:Uncharacterized protein n=1 Tax=Linum trigynum TaxID=586398 RepID=A0AAV2CY12_9ROSI
MFETHRLVTGKIPGHGQESPTRDFCFLPGPPSASQRRPKRQIPGHLQIIPDRVNLLMAGYFAPPAHFTPNLLLSTPNSFLRLDANAKP